MIGRDMSMGAILRSSLLGGGCLQKRLLMRPLRWQKVCRGLGVLGLAP